MTEKTYIFADTPVRMAMAYERTVHFCSGYEADEERLKELTDEEIFVSVTDEEIDSEIVIGKEYGNHFTRGGAENIALYRKLCEKLIDRGIFLFHCSSIEVDGCAYVFGAPSGTGKSTHVRLWKERFGDRATVINDDKPLMRLSEDGVYVYGMPWCGKHGLNTNKRSPIKALCFLEQGTTNEIHRLTPLESYLLIHRQIYLPKDRELKIKSLKMAKQFAERIPAYHLSCDISQAAVDASYGAMSGSAKDAE